MSASCAASRATFPARCPWRTMISWFGQRPDPLKAFSSKAGISYQVLASPGSSHRLACGAWYGVICHAMVAGIREADGRQPALKFQRLFVRYGRKAAEQQIGRAHV